MFDLKGMAHGRPRNASASDEYDTSQSLERDKPPPLLARTRSQTLPHEPVIVTHRRVPPPPPPPPTRIASSLPHPLCRQDAAAANVADDDEDEDSDDSCEYEQLYSNDIPPVAQTESLNIPVDGNVSSFTSSQLQQLMRQLNIPASTLSQWHKLGIDGRTFAEMSDSDLAAYNVALPLVIYFRDRSRLDVLSRL